MLQIFIPRPDLAGSPAVLALLKEALRPSAESVLKLRCLAGLAELLRAEEDVLLERQKQVGGWVGGWERGSSLHLRKRSPAPARKLFMKAIDNPTSLQLLCTLRTRMSSLVSHVHCLPLPAPG